MQKEQRKQQKHLRQQQQQQQLWKARLFSIQFIGAKCHSLLNDNVNKHLILATLENVFDLCVSQTTPLHFNSTPLSTPLVAVFHI